MAIRFAVITAEELEERWPRLGLWHDRHRPFYIHRLMCYLCYCERPCDRFSRAVNTAKQGSITWTGEYELVCKACSHSKEGPYELYLTSPVLGLDDTKPIQVFISSRSSWSPADPQAEIDFCEAESLQNAQVDLKEQLGGRPSDRVTAFHFPGMSASNQPRLQLSTEHQGVLVD